VSENLVNASVICNIDNKVQKHKLSERGGVSNILCAQIEESLMPRK
jgi:hypothetical protein